MESIYLDNNATTRVDERVFTAMRPYLTHQFAHPSSPHLLGIKVREKIEQARDSVAVLLGTSHPDEIRAGEPRGARTSRNLEKRRGLQTP